MSNQTKSKKRVTYYYENFPFEKMSIITEGDGFFRNTAYKRVRMSTRINGGEYAITFDQDFKAGPIIYLVYEDAPEKPSTSIRFVLHPLWDSKDSNGQVTRKESENGKKVKAFWIKYRARVVELLSALPKDKLIELIGAKRAADIDGTLEPIFSFPDVEGMDGVPDENKPEQFKCKLFTGDYKKMKKPLPREELLMIPGTDIVIFTNLRTCYGDGSPDEGKRILEYNKAKSLMYCKEPHDNATTRYFALMGEPVINSPSISYGKTDDGAIHLPLNSLTVTNKKVYGGDGGLTEKEKENLKKRRLDQMEALGFAADDYTQSEKKPKLDDSSSHVSSILPPKNELSMGNDLYCGSYDDYDDMDS